MEGFFMGLRAFGLWVLNALCRAKALSTGIMFFFFYECFSPVKGTKCSF